ncbi:Peptide deformylase, partial [Dillenia turbinata]
PESVSIDAQDITGAKYSIDLSGLPSRVFQHEYDHLQTPLAKCRLMTDEVLGIICARLQALEKKYEERTGSPSPEKIDTCQSRKVAAGTSIVIVGYCWPSAGQAGGPEKVTGPTRKRNPDGTAIVDDATGQVADHAA